MDHRTRCLLGVTPYKALEGQATRIAHNEGAWRFCSPTGPYTRAPATCPLDDVERAEVGAMALCWVCRAKISKRHSTDDYPK